MNDYDRLAEEATTITSRIKDQKLRGNPLIIIALIGLLIDIVRLWYTCRSSWDSPGKAALEGRPALRLIARRHARLRLIQQGLDPQLAPQLVEATLEELAVAEETRIGGVIAACASL